MVIVKIIICIAIIIMKNMTGQFVIHCLQCKTKVSPSIRLILENSSLIN